MANLVDPIRAYDLLAPDFERISNARHSYLNAVEQLVCAYLPDGAQTMLDIGSGDGRRALRIAERTCIQHLTLLEPSHRMRAKHLPVARSLDLRAEQLDQLAPSFDAVTCLWNVIGHVFPAAARTTALQQIARLLSARGVAFLDVAHRYNMRHYGLPRTAARMLMDTVRPSPGADVCATFRVGGRTVSTPGHVFTRTEMNAMFKTANLKIVAEITVDYQSGEICRCPWDGHLLYILERAK